MALYPPSRPFDPWSRGGLLASQEFPLAHDPRASQRFPLTNYPGTGPSGQRWTTIGQRVGNIGPNGETLRHANPDAGGHPSTSNRQAAPTLDIPPPAAAPSEDGDGPGIGERIGGAFKGVGDWLNAPAMPGLLGSDAGGYPQPQGPSRLGMIGNLLRNFGQGYTQALTSKNPKDAAFAIGAGASQAGDAFQNIQSQNYAAKVQQYEAERQAKLDQAQIDELKARHGDKDGPITVPGQAVVLNPDGTIKFDNRSKEEKVAARSADLQLVDDLAGDDPELKKKLEAQLFADKTRAPAGPAAPAEPKDPMMTTEWANALHEANGDPAKAQAIMKARSDKLSGIAGDPNVPSILSDSDATKRDAYQTLGIETNASLGRLKTARDMLSSVKNQGPLRAALDLTSQIGMYAGDPEAEEAFKKGRTLKLLLDQEAAKSVKSIMGPAQVSNLDVTTVSNLFNTLSNPEGVTADNLDRLISEIGAVNTKATKGYTRYASGKGRVSNPNLTEEQARAEMGLPPLPAAAAAAAPAAPGPMPPPQAAATPQPAPGPGYNLRPGESYGPNGQIVRGPGVMPAPVVWKRDPKTGKPVRQ